jgi:hypothetical protein
MLFLENLSGLSGDIEIIKNEAINYVFRLIRNNVVKHNCLKKLKIN